MPKKSPRYEVSADGFDTMRLSEAEEFARRRRVDKILVAAYIHRRNVPVDVAGETEVDLLDVLGVSPQDRTLGILAVQMVDESPRGINN